VHWDDLVQGSKAFQGQHLSDPVLVRHDGLPLYTLSSVVDDLAFGITHVIRGEDHVSNTAVQLQITQALGGQVPTYAHLPLLIDAEGKGLSKRLGSLSLGELKRQGLEPLAIASYLAKLGTADAIQLRGSLEELGAELDLARFNRAQPRFDEQELWQLNARQGHALPFEAVAARVPKLDSGLWEAVRGNLTRVEAAADWIVVRDGPLSPVIEDAAFCAEAAALLPAEPFDATTWKAWTEAVKSATGRKGRPLYHPLRLALTARESGPEMAALLPLIGRSKAERRLKGEVA
jgi:glutamyl-tRNA synthetase